jgi:hypothetical protein
MPSIQVVAFQFQCCVAALSVLTSYMVSTRVLLVDTVLFGIFYFAAVIMIIVCIFFCACPSSFKSDA